MPTDTPVYQAPEATANEERTIDIKIRVIHTNGQILAECLPTLHNFLIDELPSAGFHAMRALANAINEAIEKGPTQ